MTGGPAWLRRLLYRLSKGDPDSVAFRTMSNPPLSAEQSWETAWRRAEIPAAPELATLFKDYKGTDFDKDYVKHMVADHKKDIKEFEKQAKGSDDVASFAKDTLPTLKKHLQTAQSLESGKSAQK
jgi:hypothetical protein